MILRTKCIVVFLGVAPHLHLCCYCFWVVKLLDSKQSFEQQQQLPRIVGLTNDEEMLRSGYTMRNYMNFCPVLFLDFSIGLIIYIPIRYQFVIMLPVVPLDCPNNYLSFCHRVFRSRGKLFQVNVRETSLNKHSALVVVSCFVWKIKPMFLYSCITHL